MSKLALWLHRLIQAHVIAARVGEDREPAGAGDFHLGRHYLRAKSRGPVKGILDIISFNVEKNIVRLHCVGQFGFAPILTKPPPGPDSGANW